MKTVPILKALYVLEEHQEVSLIVGLLLGDFEMNYDWHLINLDISSRKNSLDYSTSFVFSG